MDLIKILLIVIAAVIAVTFKIYINRMRKEKVELYLSKISCSACGSNQLYIDARIMHNFFKGLPLTISCFECGNTWQEKTDK
ncbi:MAG: hypothetical protein GX660_08905 [Clostridiaceae bacterium]|nr:hypothetical protein [Clostridiaceae bacterium]